MAILSGELRIKDGFSGTFSKAKGETNQIQSKLKILGNMAVKPVVKIKDEATASISRIKGLLTGALAGAAAGFGLFKLTEKAVEAGDNIYRLSSQLHVSAEEASLMNRVLKLTNVEAKPFIATMIRLDKAVESAGAKGNATTEALSEFGVSLYDDNGKLLSYTQQLERLAGGYQKAIGAGQEEEFVANILGARGAELVPLLEEYTVAMEAASQVKGIGIDPKKAHEQAVAMKVLKMQVGQVGLSLADAFMPFAQHITPLITSAFTRLAETIKSHSGEIKKFMDDMGAKVNGVVNRIRAKFEDPGFQNLDWGGKLSVILDAVISEVVPKAAEAGAKIGAAFGKSFAEGLLDAISSDYKVSLLVGVWAGSKVPGPLWAKLAVGGAIAYAPAAKEVTRIESENALQDYYDQVKPGEHASGLSYVPYDKYPALLHRGERVLTASENRQAGRGVKQASIIIQKLADRIDASNPADVDGLLAGLEERLLAVAANMGVA